MHHQAYSLTLCNLSSKCKIASRYSQDGAPKNQMSAIFSLISNVKILETPQIQYERIRSIDDISYGTERSSCHRYKYDRRFYERNTHSSDKKDTPLNLLQRLLLKDTQQTPDPPTLCLLRNVRQTNSTRTHFSAKKSCHYFAFHVKHQTS